MGSSTSRFYQKKREEEGGYLIRGRGTNFAKSDIKKSGFRQSKKMCTNSKKNAKKTCRKSEKNAPQENTRGGYLDIAEIVKKVKFVRIFAIARALSDPPTPLGRPLERAFLGAPQAGGCGEKVIETPKGNAA